MIKALEAVRVAIQVVPFALVFLAQAHAEEQPASAADINGGGPLTVVVTATRVSRDGYEPPTPTTVVGPDMLELRTPGTLGDALALLPAMRNSEAEGTGSLVFGVGAGRDFANLRGLGPNRTLVLLDGERVLGNTLSAQPDLSLLPSALVSRVEVVTGGASAAYGSDAIAGVVNFVLDSGFTGFKINANGGTSIHSDATESKLSLTWGGSLGDGLHAIASAEYDHRDGLPPGSRDFATPAQIVPNPQYTATNGQQPLRVVANAYDANQSYGGLILNGPLAGQQFLPDGTTAPYVPSSCTASKPYLLCNSKQNLASTRDTISITAPQERGTAFGRVIWEATENIKAHLDLLVARSETSITSVPFNSQGFNAYLPISVATNAFLPTPVRSLYLAAGVPTLMIGRLSSDEGTFEETISERSVRIAMGLDMRLSGSWNLNTLLSYSTADNNDRRVNDYDVARFLGAVDSVLVNGTPTCAVNAAKVVDPGCAPANVFGAGNLSAAAKAYFLGTVYKPLYTAEDVAELNVKGEPLSTWAGPVSLASGAQYRRDTADQRTSDPTGMYMFSGQPAFSGSIAVEEAYIESVAPLAKGVFLVESLDIDGAARLAHYDRSGTEPSWKMGLNFAPWSELRVRAVVSQDIRAPNIGELDTPNFPSSITTLLNPLPHGLPIFNSLGVAPGQNLNVREIDGGNSSLRPEVAHTASFGVVVQPAALPGFRASLDHYRIRVGDAITSLSVQTIVQSCGAGDGHACALISLPPTSSLPLVENMEVNAESFVTRGLDAEAAWHGAVLGGSMSVRALANYLQEYRLLVAGAQAQDLRGDLGSGLPELQGDVSVQYARHLTTLLLDGTYIGAGDYDKALQGMVQNNHVPHVWYLGATVQQGVPLLGWDCFVYASVNNLLNQAPPHPGFGIFSSENNSIFSGIPYDRIGTFFRLGVRAKF